MRSYYILNSQTVLVLAMGYVKGLKLTLSVSCKFCMPQRKSNFVNAGQSLLYIRLIATGNYQTSFYARNLMLLNDKKHRRKVDDTRDMESLFNHTEVKLPGKPQ